MRRRAISSARAVAFGHPIARRRFGQNFLVARATARRIAASLDPGRDEAVLEIGPGRGILTEALLERAKRIAAVEIDRDLVSALRSRHDPDRLVLVEGDVLRIPLPAVLAALGMEPSARLAIAGNLPFNISKPVALKLVRERRHVARAALTFQREVAERLTAKPGRKSYGPLTVLVGRAYHVRPLFDLEPAAFRPRPRVVSTVTFWERRPDEDLPEEIESRLRSCLAVCFAQRRRTLANNLRARVRGAGDEVQRLLDGAGLEGSLRAEAVAPEAFLRLAALWPSDLPAKNASEP